MRQYLSQGLPILHGMTSRLPESELPQVTAPLVPRCPLRFEVGQRMAPERYAVVAVSGKSFTWLHDGRRQRLPLARWRPWLRDLCMLGSVYIDGHPMQWPTIVSDPPETNYMLPDARRVRVDRARNQVLAKYRIVPEAEVNGLLRFALHGGSQAWIVSVDPTAVRQPKCTCPDFTQRGGEQFACKHILAVLLSQPQLRFQALEFLL